ncbi:MAG: cysteine hydrolase [Bacteroidales bacterium]|nr:cysteine hydrolase [Bacteroidales bacterium]
MRTKFISALLTLLLGSIALNSFSQAPVAPLKPALLVIDIQNAFLPSIPEADREPAMRNINYYISLFRNHGCPVILVYHHGEEYGVRPGTDLFEFPSTVMINADDPKVIKTYPDGFNKTDLDKVIKEQGCNVLFLTGLSAVGCVLATYMGAMNNDYKAFLVKDAIMSHNTEYTRKIEEIFGAVSPDVVTLVLETAGK